MLDKEKMKKEIENLVNEYHTVVKEGEEKDYNEEDTKKDFILPLFEALGWNVKKRKEVTAEKKVSKGRVDYAFRISAIPKFFVEAKPFRENIDDRKYIDQAINYGYLKGVTWVVLTNFKKIKIFNTELAQIPAISLFFELDCDEFISKFETKLFLLSKESLDANLLSKTAEDWGKKYSRKPLDQRLFSDLMKFRNLLKKSILQNNSEKMLKTSQVEESVQRLISRLIFIRTIEDREYEENILHSSLRENPEKSTQSKLNSQFEKLNEIYNAKLFMHHLCDDLKIGDYPWRITIEGLYHSEEQMQDYDFSLIDADILGGIYEEYLGYVLKTGGEGEFSEEAERKALEGIYYTPKQIVDFIVRTIFEKIEEDGNSLEKITILDLACGSGSFLLNANNNLLERSILKNNPSTLETIDVTTAPYEEKLRIVEDNIFGVDLDPMAVEITQLNLFLKGAEKHKKLPLLREKIKCGNSLVDDKKISPLNSFNWNEEFPEIMKDGKKGFDVILGNPPYDVLLTAERDQSFITELEYLKNHELYKSASGGRANVFRFMVVRALTLLSEGGYFGFIIPLAIISDLSSAPLRKFILENFQIISIDCFPQKDDPNNRIFFSAKISTCIMILKKAKPSHEFIVRTYPGKDFSEIHKEYKVSSNQIKKFDPNSYSIPMVSSEEWNLLKKLHLEDNFITFEQIADSYQGEMNLTNQKKHFTEDPNDLVMLKGVEIGKYRINKKLSQGKKEWFSKKGFENLKATFKRIDHITKERIVTQQVTGVDDSWRLTVTIVKPDTILANSTNYLLVKNGLDPKLLCAILNSKMMDWRFRRTSTNNHVNTYEIDSLPFPKKYDQSLTKKIVELTSQLLETNSKYVEIGNKDTEEKLQLESEIEKIDSEINGLVYKFYGLNEDDVDVIKRSPLTAELL